MTCILKPGDILYIPSGWWRHDHGLCPEHIALEISVAAGQRVRSDESLEILVSRDLERRVGETEGAENIKHWLQIIGRAEESDWIDLGTVLVHLCDPWLVPGCGRLGYLVLPRLFDSLVTLCKFID